MMGTWAVIAVSAIVVGAILRDRPPARENTGCAPPPELTNERAAPLNDERAVTRARMLRRFEAWLDDILTHEEPPQGIAAEIWSQLQEDDPSISADPGVGGGELYSMWSALVALTQETKLQGRAFKQLSENLHAAKDDASEEQIDVLLDMRDRLIRGRKTAQQHVRRIPRQTQSHWRVWLSGKQIADNTALQKATQALLQGYLLSVERLDEALDSLGIQEIDCPDQPFDPQRMMAVDIEETERVPQGTVLNVYRTGYERQNRVLRVAEVQVARRPHNVTEQGIVNTGVTNPHDEVIDNERQ